MRRSRSSASNFSRFAWFRYANCFSTAWWSTACPAGQEVTVHTFIIGMKMRRLCSGVAGVVSCSCKRRGAGAVLPVLLHSGFHPVLSFLTQSCLTPAMLPILLPHFCFHDCSVANIYWTFFFRHGVLGFEQHPQAVHLLPLQLVQFAADVVVHKVQLFGQSACLQGVNPDERAREDRMGSATACTPYHKVFNSGVLHLGSEMRVLLQDPLHLHQVMLVMQL